MTFVITQPCIDTKDQSCVEVCPVDCIHFDGDADRILYINPAECIDCGACLPACPVSAIFTEADVPPESAAFTLINALWYDDPAAARAQVEAAAGGGGAAAAAPSAAPSASAAAAAPAEAATAAATPPAASAAATSAAAATPAVATVARQVPATAAAHHGGVVVSQYHLPSPTGLIGAIGLGVAFALMWMAPGPNWLEIAGVPISATVVVLLPIAALFALLFLSGEFRTLGLFAARSGRTSAKWREGRTTWGRSEESRRIDQQRAVATLAGDRFAFPSPQHPDYRTHVNLPTPSLALEFGGGGGEKVFPDILVVRYPGNYPVMVAQVETRETVTREQAVHVWAQLETSEAPLYIYVPSGLGTIAKDYARSAGIRHARIRTWRRQPGGMIVAEV